MRCIAGQTNRAVFRMPAILYPLAGVLHRMAYCITLTTGHLYAQNFPIVEIAHRHFINEPSIAINPSNPANIIVGTNLNHVFISFDTGHTWQGMRMRADPYRVYGDPVVLYDTAGHAYFFSLCDGEHWLDRLLCQKSTDGGRSWPQIAHIGYAPPTDQDKEWAAYDPIRNALYLLWTRFDDYGSKDPQDSSYILFSKSLDGGQTWTHPIRINRIAGDCIDGDSTVEGAIPAVGPHGELYTAWAGPQGIVFDRSFDGGDSWLVHDIFVDSMPGGWAYDIPGLYRCGGLPTTLCDVSDGPYRGRIYIIWADQRHGPDNTDLWLRYSDDHGNTWSPRIRINTPGNHRHQFLPAATIDPATGYLWIVYYDRDKAQNSDDIATWVHLAYSTDGGQSFRHIPLTDKPFYPNPKVFFGDYIGIAAYKQIVRAVWTHMDDDGKSRIRIALINGHSITKVKGDKP